MAVAPLGDAESPRAQAPDRLRRAREHATAVRRSGPGPAGAVTCPRSAALLLVLAGCGGHVEQQRSLGVAAGVAGSGGEGGGQAGGRLDGDAGATEQAPIGEGGAAPQMAGDAGAQAATHSRIGSGTRSCQDDRYCFGLSCYAPLDLAQHVCVAGCRRDADCGPTAVCLASADLEPGCYQRCRTPFDCDYGFDCFDFANAQQMLVCFPTAWAADWQRNRR